MRKRLLYVCIALTVARSPNPVLAQFTDPRTYANSPVGVNQIELMYGYDRSNASIESSVIVGEAKLNLNQGFITYTRYFGVLHRLTWMEATVPIAGASGSISGPNINESIIGTSDFSYQIGMLLKGGPALSVAEFERYKPTTSVGASLTFTAPTGQYDHNKLLNLGSDRWSFEPEVGVSQPFGAGQKWVFDGHVNTYFFTDNRTYRGLEILRQRALPGVEAHISYSINDRVWASLDTRYSFKGETLIDGVDQNDAQHNFVVGNEVNVALNERSTLTFVFAKALVHENGPNSTGFAVRYDYVWGKGIK